MGPQGRPTAILLALQLIFGIFGILVTFVTFGDDAHALGGSSSVRADLLNVNYSGIWNNGIIIEAQTPSLVTPAYDLDTDYVGQSRLWPASIQYKEESAAESGLPYLQSDMNLGIQKRYNFTLSLRAKNGENRNISIPAGWYQVQIAVIRSPLTNQYWPAGTRPPDVYDRFVTAAWFFHYFDGGDQIIRAVSLRFPKRTDLVLEHEIFVELIPLTDICAIERPNGPTRETQCVRVNKNGEPDVANSRIVPRESVKTYMFSMPFVPNKTADAGSRGLADVERIKRPFKDPSLAHYIAAASKRQKDQKLRPRALKANEYADKYNLKLMSIDDPSLRQYPGRDRGMPSPASWIRGLLNRNPDKFRYQLGKDDIAMANSLCMVLREEINPGYNNVPFTFDCLKDLKSRLRLSVVTHIGRLHPKAMRDVYTDTLVYAIMSNYMQVRSHTEDSSRNVTLDLTAIPYKILEMVGIPRIVAMSNSVSSSDSRATSESGIASISMSYDLKYHLQYIQATNSYRCLQVSVLPRKDTPPDLNGKPIRGLYICESGLRPVTFFDVHMQVSKTCRSTDCYSPKVQSTNFTIRGDRDISAFLYSVRQGIQADHGNSVPRFEDIPGAARYFAGLAMAEPMVNVAPVVMPNENIPSFMGRLFGAHEEEFRTDGDH